MKKPARIIRHEPRTIDGRRCLVVIGKDSAGRHVEIAIPEDGLQLVFADAVRRMMAHEAQEGREDITGRIKIISALGTPAEVRLAEFEAEDAVILITKKGEPEELSLRYSSEDARAVGEELIRAADAIDSGNQPKPNVN